MKKKVTFEKVINFPTMIGEISAISLDKNLKFIDSSNVDGELILSGKYKLTEASRLEEDFNYKMPIEIALTEKLDLDTVKIEIVDFNYDIDGDSIICKIELLIEGLEVIEDILEVQEEDRECDGDPIIEKEIEIPVLESKNIEDVEPKSEEDNSIDRDDDASLDKSLFVDVEDESDTYGTFVVYIVRQNESINSIIEKYNTNLEEIEKYNDLSTMEIGSKIIIPLLNE